MPSEIPQALRKRGIKGVKTNRRGRGVRLGGADLFSIFGDQLTEYVEAKYGKSEEVDGADDAAAAGRSDFH